MDIQELQVRRDEIAKTRLHRRPAPELNDGEALAKVDRFALTANNITYGVVGEKIGYWKFFPAADGWGVIPVWGFADIIASKHPDIRAGERLYGYFPMGTHVVMRPDRISEARLIDGAEHRAGLPPVYNSYARVNAEPHFEKAMEDERMLLFPLYATSFCLYDFLKDNDNFGAAQVIIPSASSKTAIGLAYALKDDPVSPQVVGVTSSMNAGKVKYLGLYDRVVTYDRLKDIDASRPSVIVDMSGNGKVLSDLHRHLGENMKYTANVGVTHYDANQMGPDFIAARSAMFFAPGHIQKRTAEWGPGEFEKRAFAFWKSASLKSRDWLQMDHVKGMSALEAAYHEVLSGAASPDRGLIVEL